MRTLISTAFVSVDGVMEALLVFPVMLGGKTSVRHRRPSCSGCWERVAWLRRVAGSAR